MVSGFQRLPTQDEVQSYDPRWITDMQLAHRKYSFFKNDSPLFNLLDQAGESDEAKQASEFIGQATNQSDADIAQHNWGVLIEKARKGQVEIE